MQIGEGFRCDRRVPGPTFSTEPQDRECRTMRPSARTPMLLDLQSGHAVYSTTVQGRIGFPCRSEKRDIGDSAPAPDLLLPREKWRGRRGLRQWGHRWRIVNRDGFLARTAPQHAFGKRSTHRGEQHGPAVRARGAILGWWHQIGSDVALSACSVTEWVTRWRINAA